jgi:hypothetical protein
VRVSIRKTCKVAGKDKKSLREAQVWLVAVTECAARSIRLPTDEKRPRDYVLFVQPVPLCLIKGVLLDEKVSSPFLRYRSLFWPGAGRDWSFFRGGKL